MAKSCGAVRGCPGLPGDLSETCPGRSDWGFRGIRELKQSKHMSNKIIIVFQINNDLTSTCKSAFSKLATNNRKKICAVNIMIKLSPCYYV